MTCSIQCHYLLFLIIGLLYSYLLKKKNVKAYEKIAKWALESYSITILSTLIFYINHQQKTAKVFTDTCGMNYLIVVYMDSSNEIFALEFPGQLRRSYSIYQEVMCIYS